MMRSLVRAGGAGIAAFLLCSSGNGAPQELRRTLVIFADVSGSIQPDQFKKIKDRVREIVTSHDLRTQIEIYPLDANANSPAESLITPGLAYTTSAMELAGLDAFLETLEKSRTPGSVKERQSCILNSLQHARDRVLNLLEDHRAIELIYISDMLEDCASNDTKTEIHFSSKVSLHEVNEALVHVRKLSGRGGWLKGARFTAILPPKTSPGSREPLERFWREVMSMHGAQVSSPEEPVLLTSIPLHLQPSRGRIQ